MMNRTSATTVMVLGLLTVFGVAAIAAAQQSREEQRPRPAQRGRMFARDVLDLTPEQEKKLEEFRMARLDARRATREEILKLQQERRDLMKDPAANGARIEGLIDKLYGLRADQAKKALKDRAEWRKIFTPEQLEKMTEFRGAFRMRPGGARRAGLGFQHPGMRRMMGPGMRRFRRFLRPGRFGLSPRPPLDWRRR